MLYTSDDKTRFICTTEEGAPCFMRGTHTRLAKKLGVDLSKLHDATADFYYTGKGKSIKDFLNKA